MGLIGISDLGGDLREAGIVERKVAKRFAEALERRVALRRQSGAGADMPLQRSRRDAGRGGACGNGRRAVGGGHRQDTFGSDGDILPQAGFADDVFDPAVQSVDDVVKRVLLADDPGEDAGQGGKCSGLLVEHDARRPASNADHPAAKGALARPLSEARRRMHRYPAPSFIATISATRILAARQGDLTQRRSKHASVRTGQSTVILQDIEMVDEGTMAA
jgi:hypothetical protein